MRLLTSFLLAYLPARYPSLVFAGSVMDVASKTSVHLFNHVRIGGGVSFRNADALYSGEM